MSIEKVCADIIDLTDEDFIEVEDECLNQTNYHHPLKPGTTRQMRALGQHNLKSLKLLKELQLQLEQAEAMEVK
ncbi:MAG: hypothetical protein Q4P13_12050 [Psychrobacter sp.]|nr:hypothetical protein [Psychrobacter sp.]